MKELYIAWQDSDTRLWHTVGQLTKENDLYKFTYTEGALASSRFKYLGRMRDLHKNYYSHDLFPLFANRILNHSRPEFPMYVSWLALNLKEANDPLQLLARSGGKRATDELSVYSRPEANKDGKLELYFLSHGLRHLEDASLHRIYRLKPGDRLELKREVNNCYDSFALMLKTGDHMKVGYCPHYLNKDLCEIMENTEVSLTVERVNSDAPIQFRLLCKAVFELPLDFTLFDNEEYQLLDRNEIMA